MSPDFHHNDFENWLREQTDRHRLFADESVWVRIQNRLHRRRWLPLVFSLLIITSLSVTWVMIDQPDLPINYSASHKSVNTGRSGLNELTNIQGKNADKFAPYRKSQSTEKRSLAFLIQATAPTADPSADEFSTTLASSENADQLTNPPAAYRARHTTLLTMSARRPAIMTAVPAADHSLHPTTSTEAGATLAVSEALAENKSPKDGPIVLPEQYQSIESVINAYKGKRTRKSWKVQFSVSPTVSYRRLIENSAALQAARTLMSTAPALAVPELETVVKHKPDLGLQFGLTVNRQLTKKLAFVGGFQFNVNKYDIRVFSGNREIATVGLNNGGGTGSVSTYTNYRSSGGGWADWLANFYFSASIPVGFQYRLAGNGRWNWGLGSSLQPTYLLSNQAYILSTDYKNYLEVPSLVRRWNLNGQVETFIGFQKGKTRWTVGPQARYQILSSYEKAYPVREHLFDIGVKLGVGL